MLKEWKMFFLRKPTNRFGSERWGKILHNPPAVIGGWVCSVMTSRVGQIPVSLSSWFPSYFPFFLVASLFPHDALLHDALLRIWFKFLLGIIWITHYLGVSHICPKRAKYSDDAFSCNFFPTSDASGLISGSYSALTAKTSVRDVVYIFLHHAHFGIKLDGRFC